MAIVIIVLLSAIYIVSVYAPRLSYTAPSEQPTQTSKKIELVSMSEAIALGMKYAQDRPEQIRLWNETL